MMYAIDEATRSPKNLVIADGTDRLMVEVGGATLEAGDITLDMTATNAKLDAIGVQNAAIIALLTTIAANTTP
jgi:hypothetical protein